MSDFKRKGEGTLLIPDGECSALCYDFAVKVPSINRGRVRTRGFRMHYVYLLYAHKEYLAEGGAVILAAGILAWTAAHIFVTGVDIRRMRYSHNPLYCEVGGVGLILIGLGLGWVSFRLGEWRAPSARELVMSDAVFMLCFYGIPALVWLNILFTRFAREKGPQGNAYMRSR